MKTFYKKMISKEALEEYKRIYKEEFGKDVSDEEALPQAISLLTMMNAIYRPITKKDVEMLEKRDLDRQSQEIELPSGKKARVAKIIKNFKEWKGTPIKDTYGGKKVIDYNGEPLFAELVVLRDLQKLGFKGVWVDSYGKKFRDGMPGIAESVNLPKDALALFDKISDKVGRFKGCWDVIAWKGDRYIFLELKRKAKDRIRESQEKWLYESLKLGLSEKSFGIVEWDI